MGIIACINIIGLLAVLKLPERVTAAENGLHTNPVDIEAIREASRGRGGLVERRLRKEAWPKLLGINVFRVNEYTGGSYLWRARARLHTRSRIGLHSSMLHVVGTDVLSRMSNVCYIACHTCLVHACLQVHLWTAIMIIAKLNLMWIDH